MDVDDDGESVLLGLGTLPTGVTEGSPDESDGVDRQMMTIRLCR